MAIGWSWILIAQQVLGDELVIDAQRVELSNHLLELIFVEVCHFGDDLVEILPTYPKALFHYGKFGDNV